MSLPRLLPVCAVQEGGRGDQREGPEGQGGDPGQAAGLRVVAAVVGEVGGGWWVTQPAGRICGW